jgi:protease-4
VATGRKISKTLVDSLGQGRVWSAYDAKKAGLVDELGGTGKAIAAAAKLANIKEYRIMELPKQKEPLERILSQLSGDTEEQALAAKLGNSYFYYKQLKSALEMSRIQTRMPFELNIH